MPSTACFKMNIAAVLGLSGLGGCRPIVSDEPAADHCYHAAGNATCAARHGRGASYCARSIAGCHPEANDGCVARRPAELACYSPCGNTRTLAEDSAPRCIGYPPSPIQDPTGSTTSADSWTSGQDTGGASGEDGGSSSCEAAGDSTSGGCGLGSEESVVLPLARPDTYFLKQGGSLAVDAPDGVLENDDHPLGQALMAHPAELLSASGALVVIEEDGSFRYRADPQWWGEDVFEYRVEDEQGGVAMGEVRVRVSPTTIALSQVAQGVGGFAIDGEAAGDHSGSAVDRAGDMNGDGLEDIVIGAYGANVGGLLSGRGYVVFGKVDRGRVALSDIAKGRGGFALDGQAEDDRFGCSVSGGGDVNEDGIPDLVIGAYQAADGAGEVYVVFGSRDSAVSWPQAGAGFKITGEPGQGWSGYVASIAGDVNGDGRAEILVGAPFSSSGGSHGGRSYLVYGKASDSDVALTQVAAGLRGFIVTGDSENIFSGYVVSSAGDVDGDGWGDFIVGDHRAAGDIGGQGMSYVVFGKDHNAPVSVASLSAGIGGFVIEGELERSWSGYSVAGAGDVNGDGLADLIVGAPALDSGSARLGRSYVIFGKADGLPVRLADVAAGQGGFVLVSAAAGDAFGVAVGGAGDVNADGLADLVVGASNASPSVPESGRSYVVFGKNDGAPVDLSDIASGQGGFALRGEAAGDRSGEPVRGAGDVNGDGYADILIGAGMADPRGENAGRTYVVFGGP